jgi:hypothetical protein
VKHVASLRATSQLHCTREVLAVESNLGFEAAHNARYVEEANIRNVTVMHEARGVGVRTTADTKEQMYVALRSILEEKRIAIWDRCAATLCAPLAPPPAGG